MTKLLRLGGLALMTAFALSWNGSFTLSPHGLVSSAEAIIGRPLTPMSYAGVARRTTARYVGATAAVAGTAAVAATAAAAGCAATYNAYGQPASSYCE